MLTICNYSTYQLVDNDNQQTNNKQITNQQQTINYTIEALRRIIKLKRELVAEQ